MTRSTLTHLECGMCGATYTPDQLINLCPACGRPLLARYNLALCRYKWALAEKDAALKSQRLKQAKADIMVTVRLYRNLGGPQQEAQYDQLLRNVQKTLGEPAGGIPALRQNKPSASPAVKPKLTPTSTK